jgi:hypothetical protein
MFYEEALYTAQLLKRTFRHSFTLAQAMSLIYITLSDQV